MPHNLLAVDICCGRCGAITTTPGLTDDRAPPASTYRVERRTEPLPRPATVARHSAVMSEEEFNRLHQLYTPRTPPNDVCAITDATLEAVAAEHDQLTGGQLANDPATAAELDVKTLAWALHVLRRDHAQPGWGWFLDDQTAVATTLVTAFRHFLACWSGHPLFSNMVATAAVSGFSLHSLAVFGAAKCLSDSGNRLAFPVLPRDVPLASSFQLAVGASDRWDVVVQAFPGFEWPHLSTDEAAIRSAVQAAVSASQSRLNLRRPGMLVLSPGAVSAVFDQPFGDALQATIQTLGRRHRGLAAVCGVLPKLLGTDRPDEVRFAYAFYPFQNSHFIGQVVTQPLPGPA